jgi:hypothetical protein
MDQHIAPEFVTEKEAARLVRRSPHTLTAWRKRGCGPAFLKLGGSILYPVDELKSFISSCRVVPTVDVRRVGRPRAIRTGVEAGA